MFPAHLMVLQALLQQSHGTGGDRACHPASPPATRTSGHAAHTSKETWKERAEQLWLVLLGTRPSIRPALGGMLLQLHSAGWAALARVWSAGREERAFPSVGFWEKPEWTAALSRARTELLAGPKQTLVAHMRSGSVKVSREVEGPHLEGLSAAPSQQDISRQTQCSLWVLLLQLPRANGSPRPP